MVILCVSIKALGDDRRSFSYYKAVPVIEKLPFKIQSVDQVKDLPNIGKSMQDHVRHMPKFKFCIGRILFGYGFVYRGGFASSLNMFCVKYMLLGALCEVTSLMILFLLFIGVLKFSMVYASIMKR